MFRFGKFVVGFVCAAFLFCACGLEEYYVMDRKPSAGDMPDYENTSDPSLKYFEFYASPKPSTNIPKFLGTAVYYKIYTSASTMISNHNSVESVNNSTNYSAAAQRLITNYGYQELYADSGSVSPLVPEGQEGYYVRIRLTNYYEDTDPTNAASIEIKPAKSSATVVKSYIPRRAHGSRFSFDFGRYGKNAYSGTGIRYDEPSSGDEDFNGNTVTDHKYYVDMYAVAKGRDTMFTNYYSNVTYLGSITIDASAENN